jgi:pimeloyl-ACP methyl ester carboxylesterase
METVRSSDGTQIAFDRYGEGPSLILVGGAFQHRAIDQAMGQVATMLAPSFSVIHYDRRGRGDSGDTPPYAVEREVEDLQALIDGVGGAARVFGGSSGGVLALEGAAAGLPIAKLAMYEAPLIVDDSRVPLPPDYVEELTRLPAEGRPGDAVEYFMVQAMQMPPEMVAGMRSTPFWPALESVAHTLAYDGAIVADLMRGTPDPLRKYASVSVPTLVMDGGASPPMMHSAAQALVEVLPNAERRTLEGQTHDVAPDVLAPALESFFSS